MSSEQSLGVRRHVSALDRGDMSPRMESEDMSSHSKFPLRRLKFSASYEVSNVDKHSHENEEPVRLCNYTNVYKNERITPSIWI